MLKIFLKKWILLFILILFSFVIASRTGIEFFYFLFWFLIVMLSLGSSFTILEYFLTSLELDRIIGSKIEQDDYLVVETRITNRAIWPVFNLVLEDVLSCAEPAERKQATLLDYLAPKSSANIKYGCQCRLRGRYRVGPFSLYFFDPWGLFFLKKTYPAHSEIYVYPQTFNIRRLPPLVKGIAPWFGIETSRVSGDEHEFYGIREYKQGDPIKRIHWLSTARQNKLIVKQFQRQSFFRATILFNLEKDKNFGEGRESVAEYIVKMAASAVKYLIERDVALEVIAHVGEIVHIPFNKGPEHLESILRFLAVAKAESKVDLSEILQEFYRYIPNDSSLIVIMLDTDLSCLPAMMSLETKNVSLVPMVLNSFTFRSGAQARESEMQAKGLQFPDFKPIFFSRGDNLEEIFLKY